MAAIPREFTFAEPNCNWRSGTTTASFPFDLQKETEMFSYSHGHMRALTAAIFLIGLSACTAAPTPETAASPFPALPPPPMAEPAASCDQSKASWAVGKAADETLVAKVLSDTGAKHSRILRPGMMVTMEFDGTRVNIRVDNNKVVLGVTCG
jgi:hypothetical protein